MLKRASRLRDGQRFRQVRNEGASAAHPFLVLVWRSNGEPFSRCGVTVSRRIGNAVVRNRARRRISEALRLLWGQVPPGWDLVWIARPPVVGADFVELQAVCARLLRRAKILPPPVVVQTSIESERPSEESSRGS